MDDEFDSVSWQNEPGGAGRPATTSQDTFDASKTTPSGTAASKKRAINGSSSLDEDPYTAAGVEGGDDVDAAGLGADAVLDTTVDTPLKENDGTKDAYVSYLVTTNTNFHSFQRPTSKVRRRFTDFVFLFRELSKQYPQCAVPPLPDKHKMEYVRGDRFGPDFTQRRAHSLHRFLRRCAAHPVLRRASLLVIFLESNDWNAHMRSRPQRSSTDGGFGTVSSSLGSSPVIGGGGGGGSGGNGPGGSSGVFDNIADTFVNAFAKLHKPDKRFIEVREKSDKLEEDVGHVSRIVARITRREADLETDYGDLSVQFLKLTTLEPGVESAVHMFGQAVEQTGKGIRKLREHTDRDYLGSLRDMEAYSSQSMKSLLKSREQKQLDFEGLTDYLNKASYDRDTLASQQAYGGNSSPSMTSSPASFIRSKIEDARGVDHEQARRERVRKLELQIERLVNEVEDARRTSEAFDNEVMREVQDFERIKAAEFKDSMGTFADRHVEFYSGVVDTWERYLKDMEAEVH